MPEPEPQRPDARLQLHGRVYRVWLTKDKDGWGAVAALEHPGADEWPTEWHTVETHDFRANALGEVVTILYQHVTPGADNDDHEHDAEERLTPVLDWLDEESDPTGHDTHPDNYLDWSSEALWQDLADCRLAIAGLEGMGGVVESQGQAALIQRMRNVRTALRLRGEDQPPDEEP